MPGPSQESTLSLKQTSAVQLAEKAAAEECGPGVADVPIFPEKAKHQDFYVKPLFCCCRWNKFFFSFSQKAK